MAFDHFGFLAPFYDRLIRFGEADALVRPLGLPVQVEVDEATAWVVIEKDRKK
ncbi:MAG: hypothetical protein FD146_2034 [Anaerolineaceae bacterium]|nr:MAG: hypothetical protein FD146_2034 [Anaerolineaceae bacterium]